MWMNWKCAVRCGVGRYRGGAEPLTRSLSLGGTLNRIKRRDKQMNRRVKEINRMPDIHNYTVDQG